MPCLVAIIALSLPRLTIALLAVFSNYMNAAYDTLLLPLLGFFFLPYTTLAYAVAVNAGGSSSLSGGWIAFLVVAVLVDIGAIGGGSRARRRRA